MRLHASCAAWPGPDAADPDGQDAVLLAGPPGAGKSSFLIRLIDAGWALVADDQVDIADGFAAAPKNLAGLIELRGLGIFRLPYLAQARLRLVVELGVPMQRLPEPRRHENFAVPVVMIDPAQPCAAARCKIALDAACGRVENAVGAFAA